jgi:hypothetical protein
LKLSELAARAGAASDPAVSMAIKRLQQRSLQQRDLRRAMRAIVKECEM